VVAVVIGFAVLVGARVMVSAQFDSVLQGEPGTYRGMAESILSPEWDFRGRPMAYAFPLAGAFAIFEDRSVAIEGVNLLFAVLAGGCVLGLARGLYGARAGALALLGYAAWPAAILMTVVSIPQIAFDLAVVAAAWCTVATPPGWRGGAITGAILGLGQYLRPTAPIILPAFILGLLWKGGSRRALTGAVVGLVVAFLLMMIPVLAYNLERTGELSISTSEFGGQVLYIGTYEPSGGHYDKQAHDALVAVAGREPRDWSRIGGEIAMRRIREDPIGIAALGIRKQDTLWGTEHYGVQYGIGQHLRDRPQARKATVPMLLSQGFYVLVLLSATAGLWLVRRRPDALVPVAITMIWAVSAMHALLEVRDRHHSYVIPLLLPFSALALGTLYEATSRRLSRRRPS
jgi:4-amino-4-deoxy-L-arabinose transferase-like glycosyltransferase